MSSEKQQLLLPDPTAQPGPRPATGPIGHIGGGIPQPDGSVLMVPPPHHPHGPPSTFGAHDRNGGGAASGVGPSSTEGAHDDEQPRAKPPLPSSQGFDVAPGYAGWGTGGAERGVDKRPVDHLDPAPDHLGHAPSEKPNPGPAPDAFTGAGVGTAAAYRPPHSEAGVHYEQGTGWAPKPEQLVPNEAPNYREQLPHPLNLQQQPGPSFQQQPHPPYQHQQQPYQQQPYRQQPYQQQPYQQQPYPPYQPAPGQFPPVQYQQPPYPGYGTVSQQPALPPKRVKTSRKFDTKTLDDNQFYLSICIFILACMCCNPFPLICAIPAFMAAKKAADANDSDRLHEAQDYHKRAQFCNIGGAVALVVLGTTVIVAIAVGGVEAAALL